MEGNLIIFRSMKNIYTAVHKLIYGVSGVGGEVIGKKMSKTGPLVSRGRLRSSNEKMEDTVIGY